MLDSIAAGFDASASTPLGTKWRFARSSTSLLRPNPRTAGTPTASTRWAALASYSSVSSHRITPIGRGGPPGRVGGSPPVSP